MMTVIGRDRGAGQKAAAEGSFVPSGGATMDGMSSG